MLPYSRFSSLLLMVTLPLTIASRATKPHCLAVLCCTFHLTGVIHQQGKHIDPDQRRAGLPLSVPRSSAFFPAVAWVEKKHHQQFHRNAVLKKKKANYKFSETEEKGIKTKEFRARCIWSSLSAESQNDILTQVGRGLENHLIPIPCSGQGCLALDQPAQNPIQPGLQHFRDGHPQLPLCNLCQSSTTLIMKDFFPISNLNLPFFSLKSFPSTLSTAFLQAFSRYWKAAVSPLWSLLFSRPNSPNSQFVFIEEMHQQSDHPHGPPPNLLQQIQIRMLGPWSCQQYSSWSLTRAEQ